MQVWMCPHPPKRGMTCLGTRPKVHTGFYKAWTAKGLHNEIIQYLQVLADWMQCNCQDSASAQPSAMSVLCQWSRCVTLPGSKCSWQAAVAVRYKSLLRGYLGTPVACSAHHLQ